ncbi:MAG: EamA/RhaT family transporter, partial [Boseongicola sp. SB0667_bin_21]|nr:EamA/RhaT family transporter [Boseongicola sp. SB0667_bin_21]
MEPWVLFSVLAAAAQTMRFAVQKVLVGAALSPAAATWARFLWSWPLAVALAFAYGRATGADFPEFTPTFLTYAILGGVFQILATVCT